MMKKIFFVLIALTFFFNLVIKAQKTSQSNDREADSAAILAEIERITQAFIDGDIETIYQTHSEDWSGFLSDNQQEPIVGRDDYMKANGIPYPPPAGYQKPGPNPFPNAKLKVFNYKVKFVADDIGVANFMLDYPARDGKRFNRLRILDVFAKRNGKWIQVASYTATDPTWKTEQSNLPAAIPPQARQKILEVRESVWRAWFANDRSKLEELIPDEAIAIGSDGKNWENRAGILESAKQFAESGSKLVSLEFPRTEIQVYGNVIILYTSYVFEIENGGKKVVNIGNGVETFVRRGGKIVNTGWLLASGK